ncbi:MAG: protein translocase subunit SecD [Candidatus Glassbacteria bacterium]|nr:protein translocase subunit SecD [Candidatus Glassbacteria bacterium]
MFQNIKFKVIFILLIFFGCIYYLWPTVYLARQSSEERRLMHLSDPQRLRDLEERSIKLGLDLQGGMHMVLELDRDEMNMSEGEEADAIDRALEIIRTRVDQFGVSEPLVQKASNERIIVELAGVVDTARARALVEQSAYLEFKLVKPQGEFREALNIIDELIEENDLYILAGERDDASGAADGDRLADAAGQAEDVFDPMELFGEQQQEDSTEAAADTSGEGTGELDELLDEGGRLSGEGASTFSRLFFQQPMQAGSRQQSELLVPINNVPLVQAYMAIPEVVEILANAEVNNMVDYLRYRSADESDEPDTLEIMWGDDDTNYLGPDGSEYKRVYLMKEKPEMTGEFLADANATLGSGYDPSTANKPLVMMELTGEGADSFAVITERFIQRDLAIVLDNIVKFAPRIMSRIPSGRAEISGVQTMEKARDLAIVLRAGALPAPLQIAESRTVGPSLGADSIAKGSRAAIIGLTLVVIFMLFYYKFGGLVANVALMFDMLIIMAVLAGFNATLTLPGIAGLILTIGMAVDANVLIFERIREELRSGKTVRAAIDTGYEKAFSTIMDANVTTFITAIVLFQFGTGPIKGFAVTLSIGLATSMFTAIYVTRVIFDLWTSRKHVKSVAI